MQVAQHFCRLLEWLNKHCKHHSYKQYIHACEAAATKPLTPAHA
jgi:hypothetical protein